MKTRPQGNTSLKPMELLPLTLFQLLVRPILRFSIYLLCFSLAAFTTSFAFRENRIMSEVVPFIGLFTIQAVLQSRLSEQEN